MKKYANRPAVRAIDVVRWLSKGILLVNRIKSTPILYLKEGKSVRQTWLEKVGERIIKKTAVSYLQKGIFLVPIWQVVPDWEIEYLKSQNIDFSSRWIIKLNRRYLRLAFMQDEDLYHALRQQNHVLDQYLSEPILRKSFEALFEILSKQVKIIDKIEQRKVGVEKFQTKLQIDIRSFHRSLQSILVNSPLFKENLTLKDRVTVINALKKIAYRCRTIPVRPVGTRLKRAARSIDCVINNIKKSQFTAAKNCLKSALKNLEYPEET